LREFEEFKSMCDREKVNCEILGEVTGDGRFVVHDERDGSTPVNLNLAKVLGNMPQKRSKMKERNPMKHHRLKHVFGSLALAVALTGTAVSQQKTALSDEQVKERLVFLENALVSAQPRRTMSIA
jgi:phosphoribosylformylglycinamidine (FGAM) synthase-like enzyme